MLLPAELEVVLLSLRVALLAVLGSLVPAVAVAWVLARFRFPGKSLFDALVHLPLLLPPVLTGYLLLVAFGNQGAIGHWLAQVLGIELAFRWTGAVLAAAVMAFPLFVRAIRLSFEAIPREYEEMAASLGARRWATFLQVDLPLAMPGLAAGAALAFAKALGEFGATITFVSSIPGQTRTLSLAMHQLMQQPGGEAGITRLALVSLLLALGALLASEWLARRSRVRRASE